MDELITQCSKTVAWNAEFLLTSPEWLSMDQDFVKDMLHNGDLVVTSEYNLFLALEKWLSQEHLQDNHNDYAKELLPLIRFPQMQVM